MLFGHWCFTWVIFLITAEGHWIGLKGSHQWLNNAWLDRPHKHGITREEGLLLRRTTGKPGPSRRGQPSSPAEASNSAKSAASTKSTKSTGTSRPSYTQGSPRPGKYLHRTTSASANLNIPASQRTPSPPKADKPGLRRSGSENFDLRDRKSTVSLSVDGAAGVTSHGARRTMFHTMQGQSRGGIVSSTHKATMEGRTFGGDASNMFGELKGDKVKALIGLEPTSIGYVKANDGSPAKIYENFSNQRQEYVHRAQTPMTGRPVEMLVHTNGDADVELSAKKNKFRPFKERAWAARNKQMGKLPGGDKK